MTFPSDPSQALQEPPVTFPTEAPPDDWRIGVYGRTCITGAVRHRKPPAAIKRALELQGNICLYCQIPIGTEIVRHNRLVKLRRNFDHFVPHAYSARNAASDFVIACHVCNAIKHSNVFATIEEARAYILPKREERGYEPTWSVLRRVNLDGAVDGKRAVR